MLYYLGYVASRIGFVLFVTIAFWVIPLSAMYIIAPR